MPGVTKVPFLHFIASAGLTAVPALQFFLADQTPLSPIWPMEFGALLGVSLLLSLLIALAASRPATVGTLLFFRLVILIIIAIPEGARPGIMSPLTASLVLEICYRLPAPYFPAAPAAVAVMGLVMSVPMLAWDIPAPRLRPSELAPFFAMNAAVAFTAGRHRRWADRFAAQDERILSLDEAAEQLLRANMGFQRYAKTVKDNTAADERKRITREIHDTVGYTLINIMMMMEEALLNSGSDPNLGRLHTQARDQARAGLNETRRALRLLRTTEEASVHTVEEIKRLVSAFESATGVRVSVEYGNIPVLLPDTIHEFIVHMLQEGMANALRHGKATRIRVGFWLNDTELIVNLSDNGRGSGAIVEGIGLAGMKERTAALGGRFLACNIVDGFQITARIPCPAEKEIRA